MSSQLRGLRRWLLLAIVLDAASTGLEACCIWLYKVLVDDVLVSRHLDDFPLLALEYVAATVGMLLLAYAGNVLLASTGERFSYRLRDRLFRHLLQLPIDYFDQHPRGDLLSRMEEDVEAIDDFMVHALVSLVSAVGQTAVYVWLLFTIDSQLAWLCLVLAPLLALLGRTVGGRIQASTQDHREATGGLLSRTEEFLRTMPVLRALNGQRRALATFRQAAQQARSTNVRSARLENLYQPVLGLVQVICLMTLMGLGAQRLGHHHHGLTLGSLVVFLTYFSQLTEPIEQVTSVIDTRYRASVGARRLLEVLHTPATEATALEATTVTTPPRLDSLHPAGGALQLDHVTFRYPGEDHDALHDLSLSIPAGAHVAVVGPSGSGKSTLAKLLVRLHTPQQGTIRLDGDDITAADLERLRSTITWVQQEPLLLSGTVADNLGWARPDATVDADHPAVHRLAVALPHGLETTVGAADGGLSGGQRQRVAITRSLLTDSAVAVLDEPTSSLDAASQRQVLDDIRLLTAERTSILITHHLAAAQDADHILVLDHGHLAEQGTHDHLLAQGGLYHHLWSQQHGADSRPFARRLRLHRPQGSPTAAPTISTAGSREPARTVTPARAQLVDDESSTPEGPQGQ